MNDDERFEEALVLFQEGNPERAKELAAITLRNNPRHGNTLNLFGVICLYSKDLERAYRYIGQAMKDMPEKAAIFGCNLALVLIALGKIRQAAAVYKKSACLFKEQGEEDEVFGCLHKAAMLLRDFGEWQDAKHLIIEALELRPEALDLHHDLGVILHKEGDMEGAMKCYSHVVEHDPSHMSACNNLGVMCYLEKKHDKALHYFKKIIEFKPDEIDAHLNIGNVLIEQNELESALKACVRAMEVTQKHPGIYNNMGIIYYRQEKFEEAALYFQKALSLDPTYKQARKHLEQVTQIIENQNNS